MPTESVKHNRCYKQGHDSQYYRKIQRSQGSLLSKKKKNSGNISMKNNGKDIPSLASIAKNNDKKINLIQHVGDNCCAV